jgi:hypothetical protein
MPPEIYLGCYYRPAEESFAERIATARGVPRECYAGSRGKAKRRLVGEAEAYYTQSVNVLISNEHFASDELPELFEELVQSSYLYGSALGRRSLTYLRAYQVETSAPAIAQIETLVQMADWDLYHAWGRNANDEALARYAEVRQSPRRQDSRHDELREARRQAAPHSAALAPPLPPDHDRRRVRGHRADRAALLHHG